MKIIMLKWVLPIIMYSAGCILLLGLPFWTGLAIALLFGFGTSLYWTGVILQHNKEIQEAIEELEKEGLL